MTTVHMFIEITSWKPRNANCSAVYVITDTVFSEPFLELNLNLLPTYQSAKLLRASLLRLHLRFRNFPPLSNL